VRGGKEKQQAERKTWSTDKAGPTGEHRHVIYNTLTALRDLPPCLLHCPRLGRLCGLRFRDSGNKAATPLALPFPPSTSRPGLSILLACPTRLPSTRSSFLLSFKTSGSTARPARMSKPIQASQKDRRSAALSASQCLFRIFVHFVNAETDLAVSRQSQLIRGRDLDARHRCNITLHLGCRPLFCGVECMRHERRGAPPGRADEQ
jgi:hypothetical protein